MIKEARKYQAYYTKSTPIVDYMIEKLQIQPNDLILEPCGGDGVFIENILYNNEFAKIDVFELNEISIKTLEKKFSNNSSINIQYCDTLLNTDLIFNSAFGGTYDKIIANPPYGAWQDYGKRDILKKLYPGIYAKETYALFLYRCIELLKEGGLLSFIIPDTFLNLHSHTGLRKHLLTRSKIKELALFPSSFFPGVNFGYANLSIITLQKCNSQHECFDNEFPIINNFSKVEQLTSICDSSLNVKTYKQKDIYLNSDHAFFVSDNLSIAKMINSNELKIGDVANCVTGFYSGNDKQFLKVKSHSAKNGKNYEIINSNSINENYKNTINILNGFSNTNHFVPIVKGGNIKYIKPEDWFMNWSEEAVSHYKTDKKARFQNQNFYFRFGIGVPMISSSSITASLIENKLFDQSIVGVFPKDESLTFYLLGFFNSPTCNKLIRTINPSTNNPANYIKKIPFLLPDTFIIQEVTKKVIEIINSIKSTGNYNFRVESELHSIFKTIYGF